jgi:predicted aldo/keto reductase-like oxidoreductase
MKERDMNRRQFLRRLGLGSVSAFSMMSMSPLKAFAEENTPRVLDDEVKMTYRRQNGTGENISLLGFGMMRLPREQEEVNRLVDYAIAHGVNYFDSSPVYCKGFSEKATGIALAKYPRKSYYIATKMSNFNQALWKREESQKMFYESLKNFNTDYIDYYLLHSIGGGGLDNFRKRFIDNGILDWLMELRAKGTIRNLGFSFHGEVEVFDWCLANDDKYHWDFVQIQMNYVDWHNAKEQNPRNVNSEYLYTELVKRGIPAVIMEPLLGGRLSKLPMHVINHLKQRRPQDSAASWAFRFCGTYPGVMTALSGMTYMEHLQDNLRTYSPLEPLSQEDLDYLENTAKLILRYPTIPCNDCQYCMPCPYGINIPAILLHYNKLVNEGAVPQDLEDPNYRQLRKQYLISYDRTIPAIRQADHCIGCGKCQSHCPQNIRIPQQLERIAKRVEELRKNIL